VVGGFSAWVENYFAGLLEHRDDDKMSLWFFVIVSAQNDKNLSERRRIR
jgi:hypothetical protein